jgi:hypothetical protein
VVFRVRMRWLTSSLLKVNATHAGSEVRYKTFYPRLRAIVKHARAHRLRAQLLLFSMPHPTTKLSDKHLPLSLDLVLFFPSGRNARHGGC